MADRYVVLGLGRTRSVWFGAVAGWANSAVIPVDFLKCVTPEEVVARVRHAAVSAVLVDGAIAGIDRRVIDSSIDAGVAVVVVTDGRIEREWVSLGATAVLDADFGPDDLLDVLVRAAAPVRDATLDVVDPASDRIHPSAHARAGKLVAVCGAGGAGSSTVAIAIAQGLASRPTNRGSVVLADFALDADQALYHDAHDVVPGVHELVDAHAVGRPDGDAIRSMLFEVESRGYALLLGLRHQRVWTTLSTRAIEAGLDGLVGSHRWTVADVTADFDGERATGSVDIEERNALARAAASTASCVVVVGDGGLRGLRSIPRACRALVELGVDRRAIIPVVNRTTGGRVRRAQIHEALAALGLGEVSALATALVLPERREVETCHSNVSRLPDRIAEPITSAVEVISARCAATAGDELAIEPRAAVA